MPSGRPERSFVAKFPSVATTFGWISSICFHRWLSQAWISSGSGSHALLVLVEAGRLPDEHQIGLGVPRPEDDLRPSFGEPALRATRDRVGKDGELVHRRGI